MTKKIINFLFFHFMWPACVLGAAYGLWWPGVLLLAIFSLWHGLSGVAQRGDLRLVMLMLVAGIVIDTLWIQYGVLSYTTAWPWAAIAPIWIAALWVALALAINHSLLWLQQHRLWVSLTLLVLSPFSYYCAAQLGAVEWLLPAWQVVLATGVSWAIWIPIVLTLATIWRQPQNKTMNVMGVL